MFNVAVEALCTVFYCDRTTDSFVAWHFIELMSRTIYSVIFTKAFFCFL